MREHIPGPGETLMLKLRRYTRDKPRTRALGRCNVIRGSACAPSFSAVDIPEARERNRQCGTLEYTQKILFRPVNHQRRYGSLVAAFILITSRHGDARCSSASPVPRRVRLSTADTEDTLIDWLVYIIVDITTISCTIFDYLSLTSLNSDGTFFHYDFESDESYDSTK